MTAHSTVMHNKAPGAHGEVEEVRAGIDWLSCSLAIDARDREAWLYEAYNCLAELADEGLISGQVGAHDLERDLAVESLVQGDVDRRHPAVGQVREHTVAPIENAVDEGAGPSGRHVRSLRNAGGLSAQAH